MAKIVNGIQKPKKPDISEDDLSLTENPAARSYRHQTHSGAIKHSVQTDHVFEQKTLKEGTATQVFGTQQQHTRTSHGNLTQHQVGGDSKTDRHIKGDKTGETWSASEDIIHN